MTERRPNIETVFLLHRGIRVAVVIGALSLCCCTRTTRKSPGMTVLNQYLQAVENDEPEKAYSLMNEKYRKQVTRKQYLKRWKSYRQEMLTQARRTRKAMQDQKKREILVTAHFPSGQHTTLVWEKGKWKLRKGSGTEIAGSGPKSTLIALAHAVDRKDLKSFLKLLSRGRKRSFLQAIFKRLERLKANLDRPVERRGTRIRFQYDSRYYIDLIKEDGIWKIYDFN